MRSRNEGGRVVVCWKRGEREETCAINPIYLGYDERWRMGGGECYIMSEREREETCAMNPATASIANRPLFNSCSLVKFKGGGGG